MPHAPRYRIVLVPILLALLLCNTAGASWAQKDNTTTESFAIAALRPDDKRPLPKLPAEQVRVVWELVPLTREDRRNLPDVLRQRGIKPDGDTYALIYRHNSDVKDLPKTLAQEDLPKLSLVLPRLVALNETDKEMVQGVIASGFGAQFDLIGEPRRALQQALQHLKQNGMLGSRYARGDKTTLGKLANNTKYLIDCVEERRMPVTTAQVQYALEEVSLANEILSRVWRETKGRADIAPDDNNLLGELADSFVEIAGNFGRDKRGGEDAPGSRAAEDKVTVRVVRNGALVTGVSVLVYYCSAARYKQLLFLKRPMDRWVAESQVRRLTSAIQPVQGTLPCARWVFWAILVRSGAAPIVVPPPSSPIVRIPNPQPIDLLAP